MAEGVWKGVYPQVFGRSKQLSLNKFFDPSTPSMRKGRNGEEKKNGKKKKKIRMKIVATTSLPAVDRPNANRWNAARSRQLLFSYKARKIILLLFLKPLFQSLMRSINTCLVMMIYYF